MIGALLEGEDHPLRGGFVVVAVLILDGGGEGGADVGKISSPESSPDCSSPASVGAAVRTRAWHVCARARQRDTRSGRLSDDGSSSLKACSLCGPRRDPRESRDDILCFLISLSPSLFYLSLSLFPATSRFSISVHEARATVVKRRRLARR